MALSKEIQEEAELAKNHLMNSNLDDRCKKSLLRLLNTTTLATNGLSVEEKMQKITESIHGLIISQITFLDTVDKKIETANKAQCVDCKAMKHATEVEAEKERQAIIAQWKEANGIVDSTESFDSKVNATSVDWTDIIKQLLLKPYIYVVIGLLTISPYGVEIVKMLITTFANK